MDGRPPSYHILHRPPEGQIEALWRACLADADFSTHYTAPEYFLEPGFRNKGPFAILSLSGEEVTAVLTGTNDGAYIQSGHSVRPQIALSRRADRVQAMTNLVDGLLVEAASAKLVDLFVWSDVDALVNSRFRQRPHEGVVMLDLAHGPDFLFRKFSQTTRNEIRRAIKHGVSVDIATTREDISSYYTVYVDWSRRKRVPFVDEDEFQAMFSLTQNRRLFLARHEGQVIAGAVLRFFYGGVAEYAANSSLEPALQLHPNHLLQWRAIEWACAEGMTRYSLGGAHPFYGNLAVILCRRRGVGSIFPYSAVLHSLIGSPTRPSESARSYRGYKRLHRSLDLRGGQVLRRPVWKAEMAGFAKLNPS
jgi:Acetyltransferase (GNAT) domain